METILQAITQAFAQVKPEYVQVYTACIRWAAPVMIGLLLLRCGLPLITFRRQPEIWAWLGMPDGSMVPVTHWENVIGRSRNSDIQIDLATVSRNHAVLTRYDDGSWTITDTNSMSGIRVNGKKRKICALEEGDIINIGGMEMELIPVNSEQERIQAKHRARAATGFDSVLNLLLLTIFQLMACIAFFLSCDQKYYLSILQGFGSILICQWMLLLFYSLIDRSSFEVETLAFFLCTMGVAVLATVKPGDIRKQVIAMLVGVVVFLCIGWSLRDLERTKVFRYLASGAGIGFLIITLLFGQEYYGAKNWLVIGGVSLQLSELTKVCFVYAGAATMDRLMNRRNLILFIAYSVAICGCLALMNDFGAALIFFCAFLVIAYLRSGSVGTLALACTSLGFAGVVALKIAPHALKRFATWRHIWEDPLNTGYQQTQALMCIASGGLIGLGPGNGRLKKVFAADSDIAFATVSEEWGLLVGIMIVLCIVVLGLFALRTVRVARSSFYTIGACTAASLLIIQVILNCLGTVDVLPLTGVTFPFLSNGGTSMVSAWGLLAFVKAADTRQNASFAVRLPGKGRDHS